MTIAIIAAMQPEIEQLLTQLNNPKTSNFHGLTFYQGSLAEKSVVLVESGVGKVAATIATTLVIDKFSPSAVINTGSAGGLDPSMNVGDVLIGSELRHHDVDVTPFGFEYGQVFAMPAAYYGDEPLIEAAKQALDQDSETTTQTGLIVTGESFLYQPEKVAFVQQQFPTAKATEMEGAAIAQTCHSLEVPFVVIRALSDIAGKSSHMSFEQFLPLAGERSANMVLRILEQL